MCSKLSKLTVCTPQLVEVKGPKLAVKVYVVSSHTAMSFPGCRSSATENDLAVKIGKGVN